MDLKSFVIELTGDGSPTLRLKKSASEKQAESMHHSGGAAAETLYIYTEPFKKTLSVIKHEKPSIGIVGLGLGYIELSLVSLLSRAKLVSFEKEQELVDSFKSWVDGQENKTYDLICEKLNIKKSSVLDKLNSLDWLCEGELTTETKTSHPFNFVAYDAFSQFTDAPLWTDSFLDFFLTNLCAKDCVFTTYACTGLLKRALLRNNFIFIKRPGFTGKRDATLALRGEFISHQHLFQNV